jgi:histone deacetylase 1/2
VKSFNRPLLMLGGGGYTMRNVSRAWAYETGVATGVELGPRKSIELVARTLVFTLKPTEIPVNEYYEYFGPDYELDVKCSNMEDLNTPGYLERIKNIAFEHLRRVGGPPSVQMQGMSCACLLCRRVPDRVLDIPHLPIDDLMDDLNQDEDTIDPDDRRNQRLLDSRVQADGELSDSDDEGEGGRKNRHSHKDDDELVPARKFVTTTGIMNPGASAASHGAGPSAHPPTSIPTALVTADVMDVDDAPADEPSTEESKLADTAEKDDQLQPESTAVLEKLTP